MAEMKQNKKPKFPTENVTLPSKGLLYSEDSPLNKGTIEMKYMTAREEDILTNSNYIENGTVIDKLLQSLIITDINYDDLLVGDKNAILIAARILGYGADYEFELNGEEHKVDLTTVKDKVLDKSLVQEGKNEFSYTLPTSKIGITFKFLTHGDENKIAKEVEGLKKFDKTSNRSLSTRLKHSILSVDGDYEIKHIREFIDTNMLARDSRSFRNYIKESQPDVDLKFETTDRAGKLKEQEIPIGVGFFWPDVDV